MIYTFSCCLNDEWKNVYQHNLTTLSKALITINNWSSGISTDKQKWFANMIWVDPYREDWVVQLNRRLNELNSWNDITDNSVNQYIEFDSNLVVQEDWSDIRKSANDWDTWTVANTTAQAWPAWFDLKVFNWAMYYTSKEEIWRATDISTFDDTHQSFTVWDQNIHPQVIFQNKLYFWDSYKLAELNSNWITFNGSAFTLPTDEIIYSLDVFWNELAIGTDNWNFYLWDWSSANASQIIKTDKWAIRAIVEVDNILLIFAWNIWTIYTYNWSDLVPFLTIPDFKDSNNNNYFQSTSVKHTSVKLYKNWIIFWITNNWLWVLNRNNKDQPFGLTRYWDLDNAIADTVAPIPYLITSDKNVDYLIVWYWQKMDRVTIWAWANFYKQWEAIITTTQYDITDNNWFNRLVQWIQALFWDLHEVSALYDDPDNAIQIDYRLDRAWTTTAPTWTSFTTLINDSNSWDIIREAMARWREIQFRFLLGTVIWEAATWDNVKLVNIRMY